MQADAMQPARLELSLAGQVVLVTGAATGIGRAVALACAAAGASVAVNHWRRGEEAQRVVAQIAADGGRARAYEADVTSSGAVRAMAQRIATDLGPIAVLVNNAGIIQEKPFLATSEEDWDRMLATDLKSVFLCAQAVLPTMVERGRGAIINIASDLGLLGRAGFAPYCTAKAGVIGLTKSLAREFAPAIRVNAVAPGPVATAMTSPEFMSAGMIEQELQIPQQRFGQPEDIAATVLFLASELAGFYTGQVLGPNGGSVMP
jgi:3-oxoacyl-[acyl-carrier protein] reductase